jgi:hypothetical protein
MDQISNHPLYRKHTIDTAINSIWEFYKSKFLSLFLISLVMSLIMQYASTFVDLKDLQSTTDPMVMLGKLKVLVAPILIISVVNLFFTTILQYYIIFNPVNSENNIIVSIMKSLKFFIPFLIIMVLLTFAGAIAIVLGLLALVVGVFFSILYLMTLYLFILPIMMIEDTSIGNTINRTFSLTHKNFWTNLGWVSVFIILLLVISVILSGLILIPFTGNFIKTIMNPEGATNITDMTSNPLYIILSAIAGALTLPLMPIFGCVLYFNSKAAEEHSQTIVSENQEYNRVRVEDLYAKPYADDHPDNPEKKD